MKIGMLSFHESPSYGATLQCYALQRIVKEMGYEAEFIDFIRSDCTDAETAGKKISAKEHLINYVISIATSIQRIISKKNDQLVKEKFCDFKKRYISVGSKKYVSMDSLKASNEDYDMFLTGSDQVWNPNSKFLKAYGLGFANEEKNTVAYAASIGVSKIPEDKKEYLYNSIKKIKHISCREYEGTEELSRLLGENIVNVLDPTLLLDGNEWAKLATAEHLPDKPYLLCFFLGSLDYPRKVAAQIAKANGLDIYIIPQSPKDIFSQAKVVRGCGPEEFLAYFKNASFICTDSFHGTAFSVNLNRPFYSFCRRGFNESTSYISRIKDLLDITGLNNRLVYPESSINLENIELDFSGANRVLLEQRKFSLEFLEKAMRN